MISLFNACLKFGHFPKYWKKSIVIFFHKHNHDPKLPNSYRTIILLPIIAKVFEKILKILTVTMVESMSYLDEEQCGVGESRSTISDFAALKN